MNWTDLKLHEDWLIHIAKDDKGVSTGKYILRHLNCPDGDFLPVVEPCECTECRTKVPAGVLKRLPFIINRDKLTS